MGKPRFGKVKHGRERTLDGEYLFKYMYQELGAAGSWKKVSEHYSNKIGKNPENGKNWSPEGLASAAWNWVLRGHNYEDLSENGLEEARVIYAEVAKYYGEYLSDEIWKIEINKKLKYLRSPRTKRQWLKAHPEYIIIEKVS